MLPMRRQNASGSNSMTLPPTGGRWRFDVKVKVAFQPRVRSIVNGARAPREPAMDGRFANGPSPPWSAAGIVVSCGTAFPKIRLSFANGLLSRPMLSEALIEVRNGSNFAVSLRTSP